MPTAGRGLTVATRAKLTADKPDSVRYAQSSRVESNAGIERPVYPAGSATHSARPPTQRHARHLSPGHLFLNADYKGKRSPYTITERRVPELIPVLCSQAAGDVSHKTGGRLPLLSARPAVTSATLKRTATSFAARTEAQWV